MYSHYPTNWWEIYREGENYIWFINPTNWWDMVEITDAITNKLSGHYVRFVA